MREERAVFYFAFFRETLSLSLSLSSSLAFVCEESLKLERKSRGKRREERERGVGGWSQIDASGSVSGFENN